MPPTSSIRTRLVTLAILLFTARIAQASAPDCSVSSNSLNCRLQAILHFLYDIAGVLSILLIAIVFIALHIYSKNKNDRRNIP